ncbi:MAG: DNA-directed RNA polymerase [Nanoarchaeota archaeon]|nr:DNA-directed RNA polymerase [Nanoarchaeota archaeon]MBU4086849.1 DNA-directed RNA polymerase [Nanoarchaeota archaeon]
MFYLTEIEDYVRVEPRLFGLSTKEAVEQQLKETYKGFINKDLGVAVSVVGVLDVGEGIIIPGDGAAYYNSRFKILIWKPELHELVYGTVAEITNFGAFMDLGVIQGMIHISQTMEDYVSFSKSGTLTGKSGKKSLHKGDNCLARVVAISFKAGEPKIGLTMRQPGLGKIEWIKADKKKQKAAAKTEEDSEKKEKKKVKKK